MKLNKDFNENEGYVLAENLNYDTAKEFLSDENFKLFVKYIKTYHDKIDKRTIMYNGGIFSSITELSRITGIPYAEISMSICKGEGKFIVVEKELN